MRMGGRRRLSHFVGDSAATSLSVLAVCYLVFWGCAWSSTRSTYAPPSLPLTPADLAKGGEVPTSEVGVSLLPAGPTTAGAVWLSHDLDQQYQLFGGVGVSGGLVGVAAAPFGGLRLLFDPVENLRLGLELSAYLESGWTFDGLGSGDSGPFLQPGVGVGMPLSWRFLDGDLAEAPWSLSLYTDPTLSIGPAYGGYVAVGPGGVDRVAVVRVPVGLGFRWDRFGVFLETGAQGAGGYADRLVLLPVPFPYLTGGASFAF